MEENETIIDDKTMGEGIFKSLGLIKKESIKNIEKVIDYLIH